MEKYFRITWTVAFAVFVISVLAMTVVAYVRIYKTGLLNKRFREMPETYIGWFRLGWSCINTVLPMHGKVMFGGFIFFLITMFFVFR